MGLQGGDLRADLLGMGMLSTRLWLLAVPLLAFAQGSGAVKHLTIFGANAAELMDVRTVNLRPGRNTVEFRNLMPRAVVRTIRLSGEDVRLVRQNVTFDGPGGRDERSPVLHLELENTGSAGAREIQLDYLAPGLGWEADYFLMLEPKADGEPPTEMFLDGWVTVRNMTGTDIEAGTVDLVAGEIALIDAGGSSRTTFTANAQIMSAPMVQASAPEIAGADITGINVFSRMRLGQDISMTANVPINRFPLFQRLRLPVEQRHIFENQYGEESHARGGFMLLPRGLEVRLVSRNESSLTMPEGVVSIYSRDGEVPQIVGQDRIPLTAAGGDFSVTQGRSNVLQGTRRVVERRETSDSSGRKLLTRIEVVITNRGAVDTTAFVREGIEQWRNGVWTVTESSHEHDRLGDQMIQFLLPVPGNSSTTLSYVAEARESR
jgi:hypothetical protein